MFSLASNWPWRVGLRRCGPALALGVILLAAAWLRLARGADTPGWYTDEGTHLAIAGQLARGQVRYLAVGQSTLLFSRLPVFEGLLAGALALTGSLGPGNALAPGAMAVLRALTGALGVLTTALLFGVVRAVTRAWAPALVAALAFAIYPPAVLYSRFGFSYNLLAPLLLAALWAVWRSGEAGPGAAPAYTHPPTGTPTLPHPHTPLPAYPPPRLRAYMLILLASVAVAIGTLSDLWMWLAVPPLLLALARRGPRLALAALAVVAAPSALYLGGLWLAAPGALRTDLAFIVQRAGGLPGRAQLELLAANVTGWLSGDGWATLGLLGLAALRPARWRGLALLFFALPYALLARTVPLHSLSYYYLVPLLPFVALGLAGLAAEGQRLLARLGPPAPPTW